MNFLKTIQILLLCTIILNCSDDEVPTNEPIAEKPSESKEDSEESNVPGFTRLITFNTSDPQENIDNWLIVHNQNGKLLGYGAYEKGESLVIEVTDTVLTDTQTLTVTKLRQSDSGDYHNYWIKSFTGFKIGSVIEENLDSGKKMKSDDYKNKAKKNMKEDYTIIINNISNISSYSIGSLTEGLITHDFIPAEGNSISISNIGLIPNNEYFISVKDGANDMKYMYFIAPGSSDNISLNFLDFIRYDHIVSVLLPEYDSYLASVNLYEEKFFTGNNLISSFEIGNKNEAIKEKTELGYLNGFRGSFSALRISNDNYTYNYSAYDTIPESISVPKPSFFNILDNSIFNFKFQTDSNYNVFLATFQYSNNSDNSKKYQTNWTIYKAPNDNSTIGEIPQEIQNENPNLNLDLLEYHNSTFLSEGHSISDFHHYLFNSGYSPSRKILVAEEYLAQ